MSTFARVNIKDPLVFLVLALATHSHAQLSAEAAGKISQQINAITSDYTDTLLTQAQAENAPLLLTWQASRQPRDANPQWRDIFFGKSQPSGAGLVKTSALELGTP